FLPEPVVVKDKCLFQDLSGIGKSASCQHIIYFFCRKRLVPHDPETLFPDRISPRGKSRYLFSFYDLLHPHIAGQIPQIFFLLPLCQKSFSVKRMKIEAMKKYVEVSSPDDPGIFSVCSDQKYRRKVKEFS